MQAVHVVIVRKEFIASYVVRALKVRFRSTWRVIQVDEEQAHAVLLGSVTESVTVAGRSGARAWSAYHD
jgi:hypothetical protein